VEIGPIPLIVNDFAVWTSPCKDLVNSPMNFEDSFDKLYWLSMSLFFIDSVRLRLGRQRFRYLFDSTAGSRRCSCVDLDIRASKTHNGLSLLSRHIVNMHRFVIKNSELSCGRLLRSFSWNWSLIRSSLTGCKLQGYICFCNSRVWTETSAYWKQSHILCDSMPSFAV